MKSLKVLLVSSLFVVFGISTASAENSESNIKDYKVKPFSSINANTVGNIVFTQSDKVSVRAEGGQDMIDHLQITLKKGVLTIENDKEFNKKNDQPLIIYISSPTITSIETHGIGNWNVQGYVKCDNLIIVSEGIGDIYALSLDAKKVCVKYGGIGNLKLGGTTDMIEINSEGVGNIDCENLVAKTAMVRSTKIGRVNCFASESVGLFNDGIGEITYHGSPAIKNLQNSGMGKINKGI